MFSISLNISLGEPKVKNKNLIGSFVEPYTEIIRLNISMNKMPVVDIFDPCNHLINKHENSFERELP